MKLLQIPLKNTERDDRYPIIIAGGNAITGNPEVFKEVFDVIFLGEAEETYVYFLNLFFNFEDKKKILEEIAKIDGVYVPYISNDYRRVIYKNFSLDFSKSIFFTNLGEFGNTTLIELTRGCPCSCNFCISRVLYNPLRFADKNLVKDIILKAETEKIGLLGASVSFHPYIKEIMEFTIANGKSFSISSLRADKLDRDFLNLLFKGGNKTITIAPEAGSEKLRKLINKGISEEDIERTISLSLEQGFSRIKLYFMIGLPNETMDDIEDIVNIAKKIKKMEKIHKKSFIQKTFSISPFVPKKHTPFSDCPIASLKELSFKISYLGKSLVKMGIEVLYDHPKIAHLEYELSKKNILSFV